MLDADECTAEGQMGGDVQRVELNGDTEMFNRFFQAPAFLEDLVSEAVPAEESLRILRDHLTEAVDVHASPPVAGPGHDTIGAFRWARRKMAGPDRGATAPQGRGPRPEWLETQKPSSAAHVT